MTRSKERSIAADKFTADKRYFIERGRWLDGAEWADATMIEKACTYWYEKAKEAEGEVGYYIMSYINDFKKAMENE